MRRHSHKRHTRVGHLFQDRFKSFLIEKESYFLEVLRYVVLNPVRANLVARPEEHEWSSHRAILGVASAPSWLAADDVLSNFGQIRDVARERYRRFVDAGIGTEKRLWNDLVGGMYLGRETWLKDVKIRVDQKLHPREPSAPWDVPR